MRTFHHTNLFTKKQFSEGEMKNNIGCGQNNVLTSIVQLYIAKERCFFFSFSRHILLLLFFSWFDTCAHSEEKDMFALCKQTRLATSPG